MIKSWFTHEPMTLNEAIELVDQYAKRKRHAERELDPMTQLWIVKVWLPESDRLPRSRIAAAGMWGLL